MLCSASVVQSLNGLRMNIKCIIYCLIYAYVVSNCFGEKHILFKEIKCALKSNVLASVLCTKDNDTSISFCGIARNELVSFYLISRFEAKVNAITNVIQFKGIRTNYCEAVTTRKRHQLQSLISMARRVSTTNFPKKCPFLRNTTYYMKYMQFDAKFVPSYLPECNFTYIGKMYMNHKLTVDTQVTGSVCNIGNDCR